MTPKAYVLWSTSAAILVASACTSTVVLPSGSGGNGASTSTYTGVAGDPTYTTTPSYTDTPSSTYSGGGGSTSTVWTTSTTPQDCQPWVDFPGIATQTVRFVNLTGQTIYLPTLCDGSVSFSLTTPNGPTDWTYAYDTSCLQTCQALQTEPPFACGACLPTSIQLLPGAARDLVWDGTALQPTLMIPSCFDVPSSSNGPCVQKQGATPGTYTATGTAFTACEGACSCDAQGVCDGTPGGTSALATTSFNFPSAGAVEVVFQPGPFFGDGGSFGDGG
jgi:hypothetical protein